MMNEDKKGRKTGTIPVTKVLMTPLGQVGSVDLGS
jgi:hypothetical protein